MFYFFSFLFFPFPPLFLPVLSSFLPPLSSYLFCFGDSKYALYTMIALNHILLDDTFKKNIESCEPQTNNMSKQRSSWKKNFWTLKADKMAKIYGKQEKARLVTCKRKFLELLQHNDQKQIRSGTLKRRCQ